MCFSVFPVQLREKEGAMCYGQPTQEDWASLGIHDDPCDQLMNGKTCILHDCLLNVSLHPTNGSKRQEWQLHFQLHS